MLSVIWLLPLIGAVLIAFMPPRFAKWFGVADSDLLSVVPNIGRFSPQNLGFMKA